MSDRADRLEGVQSAANLKTMTVTAADTVDYDKPLPVGAGLVVELGADPKQGDLVVLTHAERAVVTFQRYSGDVRVHLPAGIAAVVRQVSYIPGSA